MRTRRLISVSRLGQQVPLLYTKLHHFRATLSTGILRHMYNVTGRWSWRLRCDLCQLHSDRYLQTHIRYQLLQNAISISNMTATASTVSPFLKRTTRLCCIQAVLLASIKQNRRVLQRLHGPDVPPPGLYTTTRCASPSACLHVVSPHVQCPRFASDAPPSSCAQPLHRATSLVSHG